MGVGFAEPAMIESEPRLQEWFPGVVLPRSGSPQEWFPQEWFQRLAGNSHDRRKAMAPQEWFPQEWFQRLAGNSHDRRKAMAAGIGMGAGYARK
jgi:hypothetical protein